MTSHQNSLASRFAKNALSIDSSTTTISKKKKYKIFNDHLKSLCAQVQAENQRSVHRLNKIKNLIRHRNRDCLLLKKRLDLYQDNWRTAPIVVQHPKRKFEQKRGPKPKPKPLNEPPKEKKPRKPRAKKNTQTLNALAALHAPPPPPHLPPDVRKQIRRPRIMTDIQRMRVL